MKNTARSIILLIAGIISIGFSSYCFNLDTGISITDNTYGGDAYTGMQNASATTARNVQDLSRIVKFGFGATLLILGVSLIGFGLPCSSKEPSQKGNMDNLPKATEPNNSSTTNEEIKE